jgi:hypothetical protein
MSEVLPKCKEEKGFYKSGNWGKGGKQLGPIREDQLHYSLEGSCTSWL